VADETGTHRIVRPKRFARAPGKIQRQFDKRARFMKPGIVAVVSDDPPRNGSDLLLRMIHVRLGVFGTHAIRSIHNAQPIRDGDTGGEIRVMKQVSCVCQVVHGEIRSPTWSQVSGLAKFNGCSG